MSAPDTEFISILNAGTSTGGSDTTFLRAGAKPLPDVLPILGLSDIVLFPGMVTPLLVESAQSIKLIDDVVGGDRFVGLVLQTKPEVQEPKPDELWSHGCAGRVLKMLKFPDNTVRILVEGLRRFQLKEFVGQEPYLRARVELLEDLAEDSVEVAALARNANQVFQQVISLSPALSDQVKITSLNQETPARLADLIAANLNLDLQERQRHLEITSVKERLGRLLPLLQRELEVLTLGTKIQKEVTTSMSKSQRDFFLREQIRAIQRELGETDTATADANTLRELMDKAKLPPEVRKVADKELERLQQTPPAVAEYSITRNYLDWLANLPWSKSTEDKLDLDEAARLLDQQHYGLKKVKDRLLEFLAVIKLKRQLKGPILCLVGPPGVGKTSLGRSVAEALGRKFARISLGGMRDEAEIRGHRRTYVGAMPGRIIQTLRRVESHNPVILLDEMDKIGADFRGDPSAALLEVLDPEQNSTFMDHYLDVPFDLSHVLFFTTANWLDPILPALRDRLEVIELPSYTLEEKVHIARRHLLPRQLAEHGVKSKLVKVPDATIRKLAQDYTREAGCRQLDRELASLIRKAARSIASKKGDVQPMTISPKSLEELLGQPRFVSESAENIAECGIAVGLAWTPVGGDILFIEATRMTGTGKLILTGSLGDVMKESAQAALSYLRAQAATLRLADTDFEKHDIHVHVPAGATPKDGPSAGVTMIVALASLLTQRRVRSELAMTGEISLRGRVLPVGGIKEKVLAAARAGIKQVLLPEHNRKDWAEVPSEVRAKMKVHFVRRISELLPLALVEATETKAKKGKAK
ncbi:MAG: endopeptidase La [Verrucomicrobia bacterium]|nr:endopeptidase La [Verrucomicrobiota bacterium]